MAIRQFRPTNESGIPVSNVPVKNESTAKKVLPHQMVKAIKDSPKGVIPPGLAKYMAEKKSKKLLNQKGQ